MILLILAGVVSGILSGLLGIGGGVITVPALYYFFKFSGFPEEDLMRVAAATALASTFLTSLGSSLAHHKKIGLVASTVKYLIPAIVLGPLIGVILAQILPTTIVRNLFGFVLLLFSVYFFFQNRFSFQIAPQPKRSLTFLCILFGSLAALLGIGGGIFMVPTLLAYGVHLRSAIVHSSIITFASAFAGSLFYLFVGIERSALPETIGYIEVPAFVLIGVVAFSTSFIGVKLSHTLPVEKIRKIFASVMALTAVMMLVFG